MFILEPLSKLLSFKSSTSEELILKKVNKGTSDALKSRTSTLDQLRDGSITISDKKFIIGEDGFIPDGQLGDFAKFITESKRGDSIRYITHGTNSYIFKYCVDEQRNVNFVVKIVPYSTNKNIPRDELELTDPTRSENVDVQMTKLLAELVYLGHTPHINLMAFAFRCERYTRSIVELFNLIEGGMEHELLTEERRRCQYVTHLEYIEGAMIADIDDIEGKKYTKLANKRTNCRRVLAEKILEFNGMEGESSQKLSLETEIGRLNDLNLRLGKRINSFLGRMALTNKISYLPDQQEKSLVYFAEWAEYGTLDDYFKLKKPSPTQFKALLFQVIYTLAVIQNAYPTWRHNDLHCENVLVQKVKKANIHYSFKGNNFIVPAMDTSIRFCDFDLADCDEIQNVKVRDDIERKKPDDQDVEYQKDYGISEIFCPQYDLVKLFLEVQN